MKQAVKQIVCALFLFALGMNAFAAERGTREDAQNMVKKAVAYVKEKGRDKAIEEFNNPKGSFIDRDLYIFAFSTDGTGVELANGANAKLIGKNVTDMRDADGKYLIQDILKVGKAGQGWVDYKWPNPVSKLIEGKATYVERVGDLVIGCGYYK